MQQWPYRKRVVFGIEYQISHLLASASRCGAERAAGQARTLATLRGPPMPKRRAVQSRDGPRNTAAKPADGAEAATCSARACPALAIASVVVAVIVGVLAATTAGAGVGTPRAGAGSSETAASEPKATGTPAPSVLIDDGGNSSAQANATDPLKYRDKELTGSWTLIRTFAHDSGAFT